MDIYSLFTVGNVKPQTAEKKLLRQYLIETGRIHRFQLKTNINKESFRNIKTTQEFDRYVQTRNLFSELFDNLEMEEQVWYECDFIFGNDAWISKDASGVYRYFSKRNAGTIGLNIFDVIEILYGSDEENGDAFQNARNKLAKLLGLEGLSDEWKNQQIEKYQNNLEYVYGEKVELVQKYPVLYQFIQKYRPVLEYMNGHREDELFRVFSYQGEHIFFASTYRLQEKLGISQSTTSRSVNMLTLIGMIIKIPHDKLPGRLLGISNQILEQRINNGDKGGKRITFYRIPIYNKERLEAAEEIVKKFQAAGTWGSLISKTKIIKLFGETKANEVFLADYAVKKAIITAEADESDLRTEEDFLNPNVYYDIPF